MHVLLCLVMESVWRVNRYRKVGVIEMKFVLCNWIQSRPLTILFLFDPVDNQGSSSSTRADQVVSGPQQQPSLLPLPDIIQCHAGLSLEASYCGSRVRRRRTNSQVNDDARRLTPGRSSNNTEHADRTVDNGRRRDQDDDSEDEEEFNSDWTVELKLLVGPWRRAGMELRAIADQYQLEVRKFPPFFSLSIAVNFLTSLPATTSLTL